MTTLTILTPWTLGPDGAYELAIRWAGWAFVEWSDITHQVMPADPAFCVAQGVVTDDVAAAIAADPVWGPRILASDHPSKDPAAKPQKAEYDAVAAALTTLGVKGADVSQYVGGKAGDLTRAEIVQACVMKCRTHPKKVDVGPVDVETPK